MPYVIAIVLVAIAALVFFSRPSSTDESATITTDETTPPTVTEVETETQVDADVITWEELTGKERDGSTIETGVETSANSGGNTSTADPAPTPPAQTSSVTLTGDATYQTPARQEHEIAVSMVLDGNIIASADVLYNGSAEAKTPQHKAFEASYEEYVAGKNINSISLSRVGGASLTTAAFLEATNEIKAKL